MAPRDRDIDNSGPAYPWGDQPWPGTTKLIDGYHKKVHDDTVGSNANNPNLVIKDEVWFDEGKFNALMNKLQQRRKEFDTNKEGGKTARENLEQAGDPHFQAKDFGMWVMGKSLHANASGAQKLLLQAYDYFLQSFDALIKRMNDTKNLNTGVEQDNVDAVTYSNIVTIDFGANPKAPQPAPPGQQNPPGGQQVPPGGFS
jgi:hypothetical protein